MGSNPEFAQYIDQFTENVYNRIKIPILTHKSFVPENLFNSYHYEAHNIAWQLLIHFSVHLKAPIRVESNGLDLERTYTVNTTVKAPITKEDGDQVKLCQNSMQILNWQQMQIQVT
ncbi:5421_t:CDS:2 [Rhizophagus irregularis]|nr:5421_t:CDS:2 [Rhizophagus irregularis]